MLRKLVKHDILSTYRDFGLIYLGMIAFALLSGLSISNDMTGDGIFRRILVIFLMGSIIAGFILTFVTIIRLFSKRLFSNEGYLTLTLPVSSTQTVIAKVITSLFWIMLTSLVFIVSMTIMLSISWISISNRMIAEGYSIAQIWEMIEGIGLIRFIRSGMLIATPLSLLEIIYTLLILLMVIVLINTSYLKKFKLPIGVGVYFLVNLLLNTLKTNLIPGPFILNDWVLHGAVSPEIILDLLVSGKPLVLSINWLQYGGLVIFYLIFIGVFGYLSVWLLDKKLELE
jgi:hypothetical protein